MRSSAVSLTTSLASAGAGSSRYFCLVAASRTALAILRSVIVLEVLEVVEHRIAGRPRAAVLAALVPVRNQAAGGTRKVRWVERWCAGGYAHPPMTIKGKPVKQPCTARQFADYQPWLPTTAAGMLAYLEGTLGPSHTDPAKLSRGKNAAQNMLEEGFYLLTAYDLTPAQQAAMYHALAQIPGLTIVPQVTDVLGRAGVGIRSHPAPGLTWTAIFDPTTFKPLGSIVKTRLVDDRTAVAVPATIVNKVGQRP